MLASEEFVNRHFVMQKMLRLIAEREEAEEETGAKGSDLNLLEEGEADPFNVEAGPVVLGAATCFLQSLCYRIEFDDELNIVDYKGRNEGKLQVSVFPCNEKGVHSDPNDVNEDPRNLLDKSLSFEITIASAELKKSKYKEGAYVQFGSDFIGKGESRTVSVKGTNHPVWDFKQVFTIKKVTKEILDWLEHGNLGFFVHVWQSDEAVLEDNARQSTKQLARQRRNSASGLLIDGATAAGDANGEVIRLKAENSRLSKMVHHLEQEMKVLKQAIKPGAEDRMNKINDLLEKHFASETTDHWAALVAISEALEVKAPKARSSKTPATPRSSACTIM